MHAEYYDLHIMSCGRLVSIVLLILSLSLGSQEDLETGL